MPKIIIASHGSLAEALLETARMIIGNIEDVYTIGLFPGMGPSDITEQIWAVIDDAAEGTGFLVLLDLFGGSPSMACAEVLDEREDVAVVTGVNLPMLLEVLINQKTQSIGALAQLAREKGKEGIIDIREVLDGNNA
jgi:mannose/fructose/sorbose-specific phosphotransferase system IIA component